MCFFLGFLMASYLVTGCVGSWFCLRCFWFLCRAFSSVWVLVFMSGFISRMCLLCRCLFGAGCRTEAGHGAPGGCRLLPNGETSTVGSLLVDCRGCGTGPGRAARCAWLRSMCVWGDRPDGGGLSGHGPHEPGPPACLCSISCCGFSHDDFSGLGRACRPRNGLNWMVLVSPPERTGKDYDQHAPSTVYPSFAAERGIRRVDRAENTCQRADGA